MADLKEQQKELCNDIEVEKESCWVWGVRRKVIDNEMQKLKDNGLTGARSDGPHRHPSVGSSSNASQGAETTTKTGSPNLESSVQPSPVDNVNREVENNHHMDMVVETSHQQVVQTNELISKYVPPEIPFDLGPQLGDIDLSFANIQDINFTLLSQVADPVVDDIRAVNNADLMMDVEEDLYNWADNLEQEYNLQYWYDLADTGKLPSS
ncbi:hypothetical protein L208DRAFT_1375638 [Tricholoma matsutake]|nr:hypothetical protein L208DRAFT_1375638 [Tricholoma matsutake 945]